MRALRRGLRTVTLLLGLVASLALLPAALTASLLAPSPAEAQSTGGSFGGGSFGGGGGSYGGGGGSFGGGGGYSGGSSYSHSYSGGGSYSSSYSSGGGGGDAGGAMVCFFVSLPFVLLSLLFLFSSSTRRPGPGSKSWEKMDITAIRIGIDWRSRGKIQETLKRLASRGDTKTQRGLSMLLHKTATLLQEAETAWLYAGVSNYSPMSPPQAEGIFRQLGIKARSRFKEEVIRNFEGKTEERGASSLKAREHEGEGVVVVTLIVAAKREIKDLKSTTDAQEIRRALSRLTHIGSRDLVALEVVWSPSEEEDRMSTLELEALYPDLSLIHPDSIAGRVFCRSCNGPYPAELERCPHCGDENE